MPYLEQKLARVGQSNVCHLFRAAAVLTPTRVPAKEIYIVFSQNIKIGGAAVQCSAVQREREGEDGFPQACARIAGGKKGEGTAEGSSRKTATGAG